MKCPKIAIVFSIGDMQEFCSSAWEVFQANCQPDEVILITDAVFGRWKESRCNPAGYEVVDCSENVRSLAEVRCSGKQSCEIPLPDKMFEKTAPCREDLKSNLKIGYQCIKSKYLFYFIQFFNIYNS